MKQYSRMYVTLQDDGSEDDLSYIKLYNYGGKVNQPHADTSACAWPIPPAGYTPAVIYLSRHGQSEYNVLGKIGNNPPLSSAGEVYARRLGEWVPANICDQDGRPIKASCGRRRCSARSYSRAHTAPDAPRGRPSGWTGRATRPPFFSLDALTYDDFKHVAPDVDLGAGGHRAELATSAVE